MNPVLLLDNVSKRIKNKEIVKGISFSITEGEVLGFLDQMELGSPLP